ncbi:transposase [Streptomyces sp. NPDC001833]|uniref:transposase n=1 Tax=Streptomyces sp. NPDC001833 TaxID=3154658 RepID=UPI0033265B88
MFIDCANAEVRDGPVANRPMHLTLAVTDKEHHDIHGPWACDGGESAKHWPRVLAELLNHGLEGVPMLIRDGLNGLSTFPSCHPPGRERLHPPGHPGPRPLPIGGGHVQMRHLTAMGPDPAGTGRKRRTSRSKRVLQAFDVAFEGLRPEPHPAATTQSYRRVEQPSGGDTPKSRFKRRHGPSDLPDGRWANRHCGVPVPAISTHLVDQVAIVHPPSHSVGE